MIRNANNKGMTLVEVLAGLAILGTLLVSIIMAKGRFTAQWGRADTRMQAVKVADALLAKWWSGSDDSVAEKFPRNDSGRVPDTDFRWQTRTIIHDDAEQLNVEIVRLDVFYKDEVRSGNFDQKPLVSVEVALPVEDPELKELGL